MPDADPFLQAVLSLIRAASDAEEELTRRVGDKRSRAIVQAIASIADEARKFKSISGKITEQKYLELVAKLEGVGKEMSEILMGKQSDDEADKKRASTQLDEEDESDEDERRNRSSQLSHEEAAAGILTRRRVEDDDSPLVEIAEGMRRIRKRRMQ